MRFGRDEYLEAYLQACLPVAGRNNHPPAACRPPYLRAQRECIAVRQYPVWTRYVGWSVQHQYVSLTARISTGDPIGVIVAKPLAVPNAVQNHQSVDKGRLRSPRNIEGKNTVNGRISEAQQRDEKISRDQVFPLDIDFIYFY